jgi:NADPH:quinone reductase-like Zn-dependent oxidoreductase
MRVFEIKDKFGLENLVCVDRPEPQCGPGHVALRMRAASVNYRDVLMVRGQYNPRQELPLIPCSDGVGVVEEVGPGVTRVAVGDRVAATFIQGLIARPVPRDGRFLKTTLGGPLDGTLADVMVLPDTGVVRVPEHLSDVQAATLPCAALTAWSALFGQGEVRPGDTVVVQGTGGVSIFALQLGAMFGARVIVTSKSDAKLDRARSLGAHAVINYRDKPDWAKEVRTLTGGIGADHVIDVGGSGTLEQSLRAVRAGGAVSVIGILSGGKGALDITPILMRNLRLQGVFVGSRTEFEDMNRAIGQSRLVPVVDRVFGFDETPAAFAHLAAGEHFGKVCIEISR